MFAHQPEALMYILAGTARKDKGFRLSILQGRRALLLRRGLLLFPIVVPHLSDGAKCHAPEQEDGRDDDEE